MASPSSLVDARRFVKHVTSSMVFESMDEESQEKAMFLMQVVLLLLLIMTFM